MNGSLGIGRYITAAFLLFAVRLSGQVYNHTPLSYFDFDANPSALTSTELHKRGQFFSAHSFSTSNPMSATTVRYSKNIPSLFSGVGVSLSHTAFGDRAAYSTLGVSAGYRTVLFDRLYLRLGATYKLTNTNSPEGYFDYYSFKGLSSVKTSALNDKVNLSVALTSGFERFYVSYSYLNAALPWELSAQEIHFPRYHLVTAGNLFQIFNMRKSELSYVGLVKLVDGGNQSEVSHYLNLKLDARISRRHSLKYGAQLGVIGAKYIHFIPAITWYSDKLAVNFSCGFHFSRAPIYPKYKPIGQLNIIYQIFARKRQLLRYSSNEF